MNKTKSHLQIALSANMIDLAGSAPSEIKLLPAGAFKAKDGRPSIDAMGRPTGIENWHIDDTGAAALIARASKQADKFVIDYDHQTINQKLNGAPAPAAGWFSALEWRPNDGLYAIDVEWTATASAAIQAKEYRYISPVIAFDKSGTVTWVAMAALVNFPALDNLNDLAAAHFSLNQPNQTEDQIMDKVIVALCALLGLQAGATEAALMAELEALKAQLTKDGATANLMAFITAKSSEVAALSAQITNPDPAKFVPIDTVTALQAQFAMLSASIHGDKVSATVEAALSDGRLQPALKDWALDLGKKDAAALNAFLSAQTPIPALNRLQKTNVPSGGSVEKSAEQIAALASTYQAQQLALGITVDDITAINHVTSAA